MPIKAVIYDMDGLLIDSEPYWRKAEIEVFKTVGLHLTEEDCKETIGFRMDEVIDLWHSRFPFFEKTKEQVLAEILIKMEHFILHEIDLMEGVLESIDFFKSKKMPLAIASSSALRLIQVCAQKFPAKTFDFLVSAEQEDFGKPHPAVFLKAAKLLQMRASECLVLEDSVNGVIAAKAAKMNCVAIPAKDDFENPKFALADYKIKSLFEINSLQLV